MGRGGQNLQKSWTRWIKIWTPVRKSSAGERHVLQVSWGGGLHNWWRSSRSSGDEECWLPRHEQGGHHQPCIWGELWEIWGSPLVMLLGWVWEIWSLSPSAMLLGWVFATITRSMSSSTSLGRPSWMGCSCISVWSDRASWSTHPCWPTWISGSSEKIAVSFRFVP